MKFESHTQLSEEDVSFKADWYRWRKKRQSERIKSEVYKYNGIWVILKKKKKHRFTFLCLASYRTITGFKHANNGRNSLISEKINKLVVEESNTEVQKTKNDEIF